MRRMRRALVLALAAWSGGAAVDVAVFHGSRLDHELCAGVLLTPSVVLTTAQCAATPALDAVIVIASTDVRSSSPKQQSRERASERSAAVRSTRIHPRFGVDHPLANNVALLFLEPTRDAANQQTANEQASVPRTASLPTSSGTGNLTTFLEIHVRDDSVVSTPAADLSRQACAGSSQFSADASVWCSRSTGCSGSEVTDVALGSPVLGLDAAKRSVVVGLRLTASCSDEQAFVHISSVLDFITTHLSEAEQRGDDTSSLTFSSGGGAAAAVGKVSAAGELSTPPSPSSSSPSSTAPAPPSASSSTGDEILLPGAFLRGSSSSSHSSSAEGEFDEVPAHPEPAATIVGGWTTLPSLGDYSSFAALIVHNTTEEMGELQGCVGVLIAPKFLVADAQCMASMGDPQVVVPTRSDRRENGAAQPPFHLLDVASVAFHDEFSDSVALVELSWEIAGMTPVTISRVLPAEYRATNASWEIVSLDNLFASERVDRVIEVKSGLVRLPPSTCRGRQTGGPSVSLCLALGSERDREEVFAFSQGFVLHEKQLVALPQCYGPICLSGLFHDAAFVAAREEWIRNRTQDTALWADEPPSSTTAATNVGSSAPDNSVSTADGSAYAAIAAASSNGTSFCDGVLIAPRFVLTAAMCVVNATVTHVRLGLANNQREASVEDTLTVRAVHLHPKFGTGAASDGASDLALVELVGMSFFVPVLLASSDKLQVEPEASSANSSSSSVEVDAVETTPLGPPTAFSYSWEMTVSPNDSTDASASTHGAGLIAAFPEGATLLGISSPSCSSKKMCRSASDGTDLRSTDGCFTRVVTPSAHEFINEVSQGHRWRSERAINIGFMAGGKMSPVATPFEGSGIATPQQAPADSDPGYTGNLAFDSLPTNAQVGFVVGLRKGRSGQNFCGGSLIAPSYVLTAAHCVVGGEAQFVAVGSRESAGAKAELIPIRRNKVIVHPSYGKRSSISYDVAIVELESQAYPAPIQLDNALQFGASTRFKLLGYGANSAASASLSPILRSVELPFFDREDCRKYFPELDASMLCAGGELARDACTGDSGSPLVYYASSSSPPILVGVVSTGRNGCGTPGVPGIYGFVSEMQAFIGSYVAGCAWLDPSKGAEPLRSESAANRQSQSDSPSSVRSSLDEPVGNGTPFEIIHRATGEDAHQLSVVKLADDTPSLLEDAVKTFLFGEYAMIGGGWERTSNEIKGAETSITFYSSGDMTELMKTIAQHRAKPLYQRSARFGKRTDPTEQRHKCCDGVR